MTMSGNSIGKPTCHRGILHLGVGLSLALLAGALSIYLTKSHGTMHDDSSAAERIQPVAGLELAPPTNASAQPGRRSGLMVAHQFCRTCHSHGAGGAPKIGERRDWAPRLDKSLATLVKSVGSGTCRIPPGTSDADEMELARAIAYMIWPRMRL